MVSIGVWEGSMRCLRVLDGFYSEYRTLNPKPYSEYGMGPTLSCGSGSRFRGISWFSLLSLRGPKPGLKTYKTLGRSLEWNPYQGLQGSLV